MSESVRKGDVIWGHKPRNEGEAGNKGRNRFSPEPSCGANPANTLLLAIRLIVNAYF